MISTLALAFPVVSDLEAGLRADCTRLITFETELIRVLEESHELANVSGSPGDWNTGCQHHWDHVTAVLRRIHRILVQMQEAVGAGQPQGAWEAWQELQHQEARLAIALGGLRDQAAHLNEAAAAEWSRLVLTIESHRKAVQAGIQGLHLRLEAWAAHRPRYTVTDTMAIAGLEAAAAPAVEDTEGPQHLRELDQAALEIDAEQHQQLGILDGLKALFMWVETPAERVRKKHAGVA